MGENVFGQLGMLFGVGLMGGIFALVAILLIVIGWFQARGARAAKSWSTTEGEVLESSVEQYQYSGSEGTETAYRPRIMYGYRVGGREYVGERLNFGSAVHSSIRGLAENKARKFATGTRVPVFYNPQDPGEATLERAAPASRLLYVIGGVMLVIAVVICAGAVGWNTFLAGR
jgi:hypothetical protein